MGCILNLGVNGKQHKNSAVRFIQEPLVPTKERDYFSSSTTELNYTGAVRGAYMLTDMTMRVSDASERQMSLLRALLRSVTPSRQVLNNRSIQ